MKSQLASHTTRVLCLRIVPTTGTTIRLTHHPVALTMSNAAVYLPATSDFTGYSATSSMSSSVVDLEGIAGMVGIDKDAIASGVYDNARCYLFATNWDAPVEDYEPIVASILGKTSFSDDRYRIEEMALIDVLGQSVGKTYSATCQKTFGGQEYAGCKKVLAPITVTGTITHVTNSYQFRDSARTEAADYFGSGTIRFTSGNNSGLKKQEIKIHAADGSFDVYEPFYYLPVVGDSYTLIPGCRKTHAACKAWLNVVNFGGFPYVPTSSQYQQRGSR
jgi:uncharacterized phage protein (TIGR02218 family)